jgi:DNA modification methylase
MIKVSSNKNDLVLDPFMGSGTTAVASKLLNRNFIGFELNKEYLKMAEGRLNG